MNKKIKLGIFGAGRIGKLHAENIAFNMPRVEIKTIVDVLADDKIQEWAKKINVNNVSKNPEDIIHDEEIDAVLICSSTDSHEELIIKAANSGKDIFCEKPVGHDVKKIKKALKAVDDNGVKLQIGFVRRFDHNHKKVRDLVNEGKVGDPHIIKITSRDPEPPPIEYVKVSGGLFFDMMIHDFDMARYLSGSEVEEVYANATVLVDKEIGKVGDVDTAVVTLKFKNGAIGVIDNSRESNYGYDQRVEVLGSQGCTLNYNDKSTTAELFTSEGTYKDNPKYFFLERYNDAFISEIEAFINSIINDSDPVVDGIDGLKPVLIAKAANKSLKEGKPIKVDEV